MKETNETTLLLACARTRIEDLDPERIRSLCAREKDWPRFLQLSASNRLGPLLYRNLRESRLDAAIPSETLEGLKTAYVNNVSRNLRLEQSTRNVLAGLDGVGIRAVLLRGALVGELVFGDAILRPYTDLDLLIRKGDLPRTKASLLALGYRPLPHALDDRYYERHHLHLEYRNAGGVSVEIHWALDHPYSLFNIPCEELIQTADRGVLAGGPALILSPEHLLLTLCVHLAKHAYCLPGLLETPYLAEIMANQNWIMHLCDVAGTLRQYESVLDWSEVTRLTAAWNIQAAVRSSLRAAVRLLGAPVPETALREMPTPRLNWVEKKMCQLAVAPASPSSRGRLRGFKAGLFLRPVRMLDALPYLWPDAAFLAGRYGVSGPFKTPLCRLLHSLRALFALTRNAFDYLYYSVR